MIWRVRSRAEFAALADAPARRSRHLVVHRAPLAPTGPARVAFAIGRRFGNAPQRNRIRRRLRAILAELDLEAGVGYLIRVRPGAGELSPTRLRAELRDLTDPQPS